jgi:murein DD-endopeptidase MepM/ murein hydrolase activator NlpD
MANQEKTGQLSGDQKTETPPTSDPLPEKGRGRKILETTLRVIINTLLVIIVGIIALLAWERVVSRNKPTTQTIASEAASPPTPTTVELYEQTVELPSIDPSSNVEYSSINRTASLKTNIPTRPRVDVITYTVQSGDSLFSIADNFGLNPETILWGNFDTLEDNPHMLRPDQELNILPVNGTYYQWHENDVFSQIAMFFEADPQSIIEYPGNRFDLTESSVDNVTIAVGSWLIIPDGKREIIDWGPPAISRDNPASARYYGSGHCGAIYTGAVGTGTFIWPTNDHTISGYHYDPSVHPAIDLAGRTGDPVYATDSGVVVYSGWSNYGYGYLIVIDHAAGWQSAYAHLSAVGVVCGQSVAQGTVIGAIGNTGNSYGSHLHFELVYGGAKVNPLNFLP